jgi:hypothetical protein
MYKLTKGSFIKDLEKAKTEEEVKFAYAKEFKIKFSATHKHDLYTPQILFEFKYDNNFENIRSKAEVLAQSLYYVHRLKYGSTDLAIPPIICLADKNEAAFTETQLWKDYYSDDGTKYDWDLAASQPDKDLVADLYANYELRKIHVYKLQLEHEYSDFCERLKKHLSPQIKFAFGDKKLITGDNFEDVYDYWEHNFGEAVRNGQKPSKYFIADIQQGKTVIIPEESKVIFRISEEISREKKILMKDYQYFWSLYEKVSNPFIVRDIISKADRLTDEELRRFSGEFFTPLPFARKGLEYIEKTVGKKWWEHGYKLWDMAAGTGNLQYHLPADAWEHCFLSTLYKEDVEHLNKLFPGANVFQYDYLNDDVDNLFSDSKLPFKTKWKLPEQLREDLSNSKTKWIILMNPPFATSQTAGTSGRSKKDVSNTALRKVMHDQDLGEVSRELFAQFLFRIKKDFEGKKAYLGLFSTLKYINSNNDQKFRDNVFQFVFERGFIFSSANFSGTKKNNPFPVGFLVWNLAAKKHIEGQEIVVDVFDSEVEKINTKKIITENRDKFLSKWINRPDAIKKFPAFKSAIITASSNKDVRDRIAEGFLGSLMCKGNDVQNQNFTALLSGPYASAGALSITEENFNKSMVIHAVRRIPKATWINDRDQFMQPNKKLSDKFISDCTVWNLFSSSNQTVAMRDVRYKGIVYQVHNSFFPFLIKEIKKWQINDSDIALSLTNDKDRFVAQWLSKQDLSNEALLLLELGKSIYKYYFNHLNELRTNKFKISTWDAGWWQIRNTLADENLAEGMFTELKLAHSKLREKLLPKVFDYGFLS